LLVVLEAARKGNKKDRNKIVTVFLLVGVTDVVADIEARIDLLARIEDVVWVEDMFAGFEEFKHLFSEHFAEVWRVNDTVVMFATETTFELGGSFVEGVRHFLYKYTGRFVGEIQEWIEVEVSVAAVPVDGSGDVEVLEELLNLHEEFREILGWHHHVFEESSWTLGLVLELREGIAGAAELPEHLSFVWIGDGACFHCAGAERLCDIGCSYFTSDSVVDGDEDGQLGNLAHEAYVVELVHLKEGAVVGEAGESSLEKVRV
jgi:hypothetical protein